MIPRRVADVPLQVPRAPAPETGEHLKDFVAEFARDGVHR